MSRPVRVPIALVLQPIEQRVMIAPEDEAVRGQGERVSYRQLWARAGEIADRLAALGAGPGTTVGLHLERSVDLIAAIIGLLRAGCVAVPLDVGYPVDRLRFMCADAGVRLVVGHQSPLSRLGGFDVLATEGSLRYASRRSDSESVVAPSDADARPVVVGAEPGPVNGDDLAYLVYTSGSTGRPKGVRYAHRNLANLIRWQQGASDCGAGDRTLQFAPASFDVIFQEVLTTLADGGTVICCTEDERLDPQLLWDLIERERINRIFVPFVMIQSLALFVDDVTPARHPLREILTSGEQVQSTERVRALFTRLPDCRLVNQWGTTETHVATWYRLPADVSRWPDLPPIGVPIQGSDVRVCDPEGRPVPDGTVGELWITGDCVGPGYLGLPERTALSYRTDPLDPLSPAYRTGDLGRLGRDGLLEFLGRQDTQVKVRGFRIELGEIESVLQSQPAVAQAVVTVAGAAAEERHLRAFVVLRAGGGGLAPDAGPIPDQLLVTLRERLPAYMVPARIDVVAAFPRTPSGKLDRLALITATATAVAEHPLGEVPT